MKGQRSIEKFKDYVVCQIYDKQLWTHYSYKYSQCHIHHISESDILNWTKMFYMTSNFIVIL